MKREFLQLAQPKGELYGDYLASEKLDGERCFWDGGISRGLLKCEIPWANILKDERFKRTQYATGLWTRYGNPVFAPDGWLDRLPNFPLDGELYAGRNNRQRLISIVRKQEPDVWEWMEVTLEVFDVPPLDTVFAHGIVDTPHYFKVMYPATLDWVHERETVSIDPSMLFSDRMSLVEGHESKSAQIAIQTPMSDVELIHEELDRVTGIGGEGLILRRDAIYQCNRTHDMIKLKKLDDAEGEVIGYVTGRKTDKGSKLLGLMGAMKIRMDNDIEFEISGFTDAERALCEVGQSDSGEATAWARANPETVIPAFYEAAHFPRGSRVTFRYRGKSTGGVPNEARYWRKDNRLI